MSTTSNSDKNSLPVIVLGAGLSGSLQACYLANRGFKVEVFERRPDMRTTKISAGRSINLALSVRGMTALAGVGLKDQVMEIAIPMKGRMMHSVDGKLTYQQYSKDGKNAIYSISRGELNCILMTLSEKNPNIRYHFEQKCTGINFRTNEASFKDENTKQQQTVKAQTILAADGAFSVARNDMMKTPRFNYSQEYLEHGYKELHIPPGADGQHQLDKYCLHIWPRGSRMVIALPNLDGSFTVTCFFPFSKEEKGFDFLDNATDEEILSFFQTNFPDIIPLTPDLVQDFRRNPTSSLVTVRAWPWSISNACCLLGDAAHAIVPFFGQGMNCAFEDCRIFDEILAETHSFTDHKADNVDWQTVFEKFQKSRKPNADAIAAMAIENHIEMRDKVGDEKFLFKKKVEGLLGNNFPDKFLSRYEMVSFSTLPYRVALERGAVNDKVVSEVTGDATNIEQIDLEKAKQIVDQYLEPLSLSS